MKKIYVLMATVSNDPTKRNIFKVFGQSIQDPKWQVIFYTGKAKKLLDANLIVIFSFFNQYKNVGSSTTVQYRRNIYNINKDARWLYFDGDPTNGVIGTKWNPNLSFYRISFQSPYADEAIYMTRNIENDSKRWNNICKLKNINIKPWRTPLPERSQYILLLLQSTTMYSMKDVDLYKWINNTLIELRKWTKRPIVIRMKKNEFNVGTKWREMIRDPINNISMSKGNTLTQDLDGAWASLLYSTSACVASIICGVPVFCGHSSCLTYEISETDLSKIENPSMPDRTTYFNKLSYFIWNLDDFKSGICWKNIRQYLENDWDKTGGLPPVSRTRVLTK